MPTSDIIGYLWSKRQDLDLYRFSDVLQFAADLVRSGLEVCSVHEIIIMSIPTGEVSVWWDKKAPEEWEPLVENAIAKAATEHAIHMLHQDGEHE